MPINLEDILGQAAQFQNQTIKSGTELANLSFSGAVLSSEDADTQRDVGANNVIIQSAKDNAAFATQQATVKAGNALGTNLKDQGELITGLSTNILDLMKQRDEVAASIQQKQSVGLFDNPLEYIFNQITLGDDVQKHAAISSRLEQNEENLQKLNSLTQTTAATQNALTESITQAGITASAKNTANAAALQANKSTRDALTYNAQGITNVLNASKEVLATSFQELNAQNSQAQIGIALQHLDLQRQEFDWRKEEKKIADAARNKQTSIENYTAGVVNDGLRRMGLPEIPADSPRMGNIMMNLKSGSPAAQLYAEAYQISMNSTDAAGGATILATSPSRAIGLLNSGAPIKLSTAQAPVKDLLAQATETVAKAGQTGTIDLKNPQVRDKALNDAATVLLSQQAKLVKIGDPSNVFNIPSLPALITASPPLQNLPVVSKVLAPAIAAGTDLSDPDKAFTLVGQALQKGTISYPEALEISAVYQRGVAVNLEARQLQSLGLTLTPKKPGDPSINSYNVRITVGRTLGGKETVDMTNTNTVGRILNKWQAGQLSPFADRSLGN